MKNKLIDPILFSSRRDTYLPSIRFFTKRVSSSIILARFSRIINKLFYDLGLGSALNRYDNSISFYLTYADKKLYEAYDRDSLFCNFGSGSFYHRKWKNYDLSGNSKYYKAIQGKANKDFYQINLCDQNLVIPEKSESVSLIYCSHTLEHLERSAVKRFLGECFRILEPGGVMRVALPFTKKDFEIVNHIYFQNNVDLKLKNSFIIHAVLQMLNDLKDDFSIDELTELLEKSNFDAEKFYKTVKDLGNLSVFNVERPDRHISYWDYGNLISLSNNLGFKMCIPLYQNLSFALPFRNNVVFDTTEPHLSIYADIVK